MDYAARRVEFRRLRRMAGVRIRKRLGRPTRLHSIGFRFDFRADTSAFRRVGDAIRARSRAMARIKLARLSNRRPRLTQWGRRRQEFRRRFREHRRRVRFRVQWLRGCWACGVDFATGRERTVVSVLRVLPSGQVVLISQKENPLGDGR